MKDTTIDYRNPSVVRKIGMTALKKELGTVGATYFLRQFSSGNGDYTRDREQLIEGVSFDEIVAGVRELDSKA